MKKVICFIGATLFLVSCGNSEVTSEASAPNVKTMSPLVDSGVAAGQKIGCEQEFKEGLGVSRLEWNRLYERLIANVNSKAALPIETDLPRVAPENCRIGEAQQREIFKAIVAMEDNTEIEREPLERQVARDFAVNYACVGEVRVKGSTLGWPMD